MSDEEKRRILDLIQSRLSQLGGEGPVQLHVDIEDSKFEDEWLYVVVTAPSGEIRPSDYAGWMSQIERELRDEHNIDNVLLVPARPDY